MKALNKHNNMLFKMSNITSSRRELNKIKNTKKAKYDCSISDESSISSDSEYSDSSISSINDQEGYEPLKREVNKLYQTLSTNIKSNQVNGGIDNELKFDSSNSLSNDYVNDTLPIVNISLRGRKSLDIPLIQV